MRSALRKVREELGEDAVILSNRRVPGGIELMAATEMPPPPPPRIAVPVAAPTAAGAVERAEAAPRDDGGWWQMQQELRSMRDLIEQQYSSFAWQQYRAQQPAQAAMWRRLQRLGLAAGTVRELLESSAEAALDLRNPKTAWQQLMSRLSARIAVPEQDPVAAGGVFVFIGPTGAGKTTTIAKLAARHVLEHGNAGIALVTTDSYRIGAHEQLRTLARILNVPCKVVGAQQDLGGALYDLRHCRLVLIDSAGLNAQAPELRAQLAAIDALGERARCLQVLAANSQQQVLRAAQRSYRTANLSGCVLTKLDEAGSLGESISLLIDSALPLVYVAGGQAIPGDIERANPKALVARAIDLAKQAECDEQRLAEAFAARQHSGAGLARTLSA
jgi:flagellar biosynthesis protein FlhF